MVLNFGSYESIFPETDETGEGLGADKKQAILLDTNTYYTAVKSSELNSACNILELQAAAAVTPTALANMEVELFSDSTGYLNKVDTTNTTATFSTNKYTTSSVGDYTRSLWGSSWNTGTNGTNKLGIKFTAKVNCSIRGFTISLNGSTDPTKGYLLDADQATIATANVSGSTVTFATPQSLVAGTAYFLAVDKAGASFTDVYTSPSDPGFPRDYPEMIVTNGLRNNALAINWFYIISALLTCNDTTHIVQTIPIAVPNGIKNFQVFAYKKTTTGTGNITCDVSLNNGVHYQTNVPLDTVIHNSLTSDYLILKLNLNIGATPGGTASCSGFGVRYWDDE